MILSPHDGRCLLELLPGQGGMCQRLAFTGHNGQVFDVLAGCSDEELASGNPWYRGAWLWPFPSRLAGGRYAWEGRHYRLPCNDPGGKSALHGFLNRLNPEVIQQEEVQESAVLVLQYRYDGGEAGYPFPAALCVAYRLRSPADLSVTMTLHNLHDEPAPVGVGWHPYFSLGESVDDLCLQLPAGDMAELDEESLPTGKAAPFTAFSSLSRIGSRAIDGSMRLSPGTDRVQSLLWSESRQAGVVLWQDAGFNGRAGYRHLQVFIPPDRQSIALEPVSCGVNAFNTGENLLSLPAGSTCAFTCGVRLVTGSR